MENFFFMSKCEAAKWYAEQGYSVFPVAENGKRPLTSNGHHAATKDSSLLDAWWGRRPKANIGLPMNKNGLVATDVDSQKPCYKGLVPQDKSTWYQETPSGGRHQIYNNGGHEFAGRLKLSGEYQDAVDIKHNGYIVIAPSEIDGTQYVAKNIGAPLDAPDWLIEGASRAAMSFDAADNIPADTSVDLWAVDDVLSQLDPDLPYPEWVKILMSIHSSTEGSEEGLRAVIEWSAKGSKFKRYEAQSIASKWSGFRRDGGVNFATAKLMAEAARWAN